MKTPAPTKLFNIIQYYQVPMITGKELATVMDENRKLHFETNKTIKVATIKYGVPYALAKSIKRQEELKNHPKGTFFKIVPH